MKCDSRSTGFYEKKMYYTLFHGTNTAREIERERAALKLTLYTLSSPAAPLPSPLLAFHLYTFSLSGSGGVAVMSLPMTLISLWWYKAQQAAAKPKRWDSVGQAGSGRR